MRAPLPESVALDLRDTREGREGEEPYSYGYVRYDYEIDEDLDVTEGAGCDQGEFRACYGASRVSVVMGDAEDIIRTSWWVYAWDGITSVDYWLSLPTVMHGNGGDDHLDGTSGSNQLFGGPGVDDLYGGDSADVLDLGGGMAVGSQEAFAFAGDDEVRSSNGASDDIDCGAGRDVAIVDQWDEVTGCEVVTKVRRRHLGLVLRGAPRFEGTRGPDQVWGTGSTNRIEGDGDVDRLYGLGGNDTIIGGTGADRLDGGGGPDTIFARDRGRDRVICGPGVDSATVDRIDLVSGCERVLRR